MRKRFTRTTRLMPRSAMRLALYSTLGGCALAWSGLVMALGLGELSLHSSLNQPLNADIVLSDSAGLEESDISVGLASPEAFAQAGIERSFFLTDLHFTPLFRNGRKVIHVSSSKVVVEPYLKFIVQVTQPSGQVLRTYTLLIDPPGSVILAPPLLPTNARPEPVSSVAPMPAPVTPPAPPAAAARKQSAQASAPARQTPDSEALTATAAQNQQLAQSLDNLQAHVDTLEQEGAEKDRQLAELQSRLVEAQAIAAARAAALPSAPANGQGTSNTAPAAPDAPAATEPARASAVQPAPGTGPGQSSAGTSAPAAPTSTAPATPVIAPAAPLDVAPQTDDLTWLLQLGALLALVLLLAAWVLQRRRQRRVANVQGPSPAVTEAPATIDAGTSDLPPLPASPVASRREQAPSTDALDAASIYIAYGRFNEALAVLREGLQREPARRDLRLRILEVLGLQGNAHAYAEEEAALRANGEQDAVLEQTRARFPRLAPASVALAAGGVAAGGMLAASEPAPAPGEHVAEAPPAFTAEPHVEQPPVDTQASSDLDIDFDALGDLGDLDELAPARQDHGATPDEFQLNLDDLSLDADWSSMDPFERPAAPAGRAASPAPLPEEAPAPPEMFFSNLRELPEVMELPEEEFLSDFADEPLAPQGLGEDDLDAAFLDSFAEEPVLLPGVEVPEVGHVALGNDLAGGTFELPGEAFADLDELSIDFDSIENQALAADRLDQARALVAQGDPQGASWLLHELLQDGDEATREAARQMLAGL